MTDTASIIEGFKGKKALVIGDIMLDTYFKGEVTRISAEAPIPIVKVEQEFHVLGGAGNVAANIVSLGGEAVIFSFVGQDYQSEIVHGLLREKNIESFLDEDHRTIHKVRIIGNSQQLARADFEIIKDKKFTNETKSRLKEKAKKSDIIVISDYAKGTITKDLMDCLSEFKSKIIADPKPQNKALFKGIFLIKSNEKESLEMAPVNNVEEAGKRLTEELQTTMLITRGRNGMTLFSKEIINIPTYAKEVFDVTGAGDTAIAALSLAIASGASIEEAAIISNHAAGIKVEKAGTYAVSNNELASRVSKEEGKIVNIEKLQQIVSDLKKKSKKIVTTNGSFDILHAAHIHLINKAKSLGDILIVLINSDESIRANKGPNRPIIPQVERSEIIAGLESVDYVIIFPQLKPLEYLEIIKPDFHVKGGSWDSERLSEEKILLDKLGCQYRTFDLEEGYSSTNIINKVLDKYSEKNKTFNP